MLVYLVYLNKSQWLLISHTTWHPPCGGWFPPLIRQQIKRCTKSPPSGRILTHSEGTDWYSTLNELENQKIYVLPWILLLFYCFIVIYAMGVLCYQDFHILIFLLSNCFVSILYVLCNSQTPFLFSDSTTGCKTQYWMLVQVLPIFQTVMLACSSTECTSINAVLQRYM